MKRLVLAGIVVALLAAGYVFASRGYLDGKVPVKTIAVERGQIASFVSAPGHVINREELSVNSPVAGQITELGAATGDQVRKGQVLVKLDPRESDIAIGRTRASLAFAEQNLAQATTDLDHVRIVYQAGGEPRNAVDAAELRVQAARKDVQLARAESQQAQLQRSLRQIAAPSAGTIIANQARGGAWVQPGDVLFKLAPDSVREIEVRVDAADGAAAKLGKAVTVSSDAYVGMTWQEKITWVAPVTNTESTSNSLSVRVSLGPQAPALVLGQQVDVKITTDAREQVLKIPSNAIVAMQGKPMVATVRDGAVHFVPVELGIGDITHTEILGGLTAGQHVIVPEGKPLHEGDKVEVAAAEGPR